MLHPDFLNLRNKFKLQSRVVLDDGRVQQLSMVEHAWYITGLVPSDIVSRLGGHRSVPTIEAVVKTALRSPTPMTFTTTEEVFAAFPLEDGSGDRAMLPDDQVPLVILTPNADRQVLANILRHRDKAFEKSGLKASPGFTPLTFAIERVRCRVAAAKAFALGCIQNIHECDPTTQFAINNLLTVNTNREAARKHVLQASAELQEVLRDADPTDILPPSVDELDDDGDDDDDDDDYGSSSGGGGGGLAASKRFLRLVLREVQGVEQLLAEDPTNYMTVPRCEEDVLQADIQRDLALSMEPDTVRAYMDKVRRASTSIMKMVKMKVRIQRAIECVVASRAEHEDSDDDDDDDQTPLEVAESTTERVVEAMKGARSRTKAALEDKTVDLLETRRRMVSSIQRGLTVLDTFGDILYDRERVDVVCREYLRWARSVTDGVLEGIKTVSDVDAVTRAEKLERECLLPPAVEFASDVTIELLRRYCGSQPERQKRQKRHQKNLVRGRRDDRIPGAIRLASAMVSACALAVMPDDTIPYPLSTMLGSVVGESKAALLDAFAARWPGARIGSIEARLVDIISSTKRGAKINGLHVTAACLVPTDDGKMMTVRLPVSLTNLRFPEEDSFDADVSVRDLVGVSSKPKSKSKSKSKRSSVPSRAGKRRRAVPSSGAISISVKCAAMPCTPETIELAEWFIGALLRHCGFRHPLEFFGEGDGTHDATTLPVHSFSIQSKTIVMELPQDVRRETMRELLQRGDGGTVVTLAEIDSESDAEFESDDESGSDTRTLPRGVPPATFLTVKQGNFRSAEEFKVFVSTTSGTYGVFIRLFNGSLLAMSGAPPEVIANTMVAFTLWMAEVAQRLGRRNVIRDFDSTLWESQTFTRGLGVSNDVQTHLRTLNKDVRSVSRLVPEVPMWADKTVDTLPIGVVPLKCPEAFSPEAVLRNVRSRFDM